MSKNQFDCDGFQIVNSKRISRNKQTKVPPKQAIFIPQDTIVDIKKVIHRIKLAVDEVQASKYFEDALKTVSNSLQEKKVSEIVCFGLGRIGECNISKYQLAFLLCLNKFLTPKEVLVHDPIFTKSECDILKHFGLSVIEKNNEGSYIIPNENISLAYFPHCPKQLTNNFLWSNWGPNLCNCILICNSFRTLIDNNPSRIISNTVPYIYKIYPYTSEQSLENSFKFTDIFNDASVHCFLESDLNKLDSEFWNRGEKPQYYNTEEFITSLMIERLKI